MLYPISYGRAKALEGLVKVRPYGSKKKTKTKAKRGSGRADRTFKRSFQIREVRMMSNQGSEAARGGPLAGISSGQRSSGSSGRRRRLYRFGVTLEA
jgi:hypothetical protein